MSPACHPPPLRPTLFSGPPRLLPRDGRPLLLAVAVLAGSRPRRGALAPHRVLYRPHLLLLHDRPLRGRGDILHALPRSLHHGYARDAMSFLQYHGQWRPPSPIGTVFAYGLLAMVAANALPTAELSQVRPLLLDTERGRRAHSSGGHAPIVPSNPRLPAASRQRPRCHSHALRGRLLQGVVE